MNEEAIRYWYRRHRELNPRERLEDVIARYDALYPEYAEALRTILNAELEAEKHQAPDHQGTSS